jgi:hypothetical protein
MENRSTSGLAKNSAQVLQPRPPAEKFVDARKNQPASMSESNPAQPLPEEQLEQLEQLEAILLDLLGPMAHSLVVEVASVPQVEDRAKRILERISQLGISVEIVETLRSRLKLWSQA